MARAEPVREVVRLRLEGWAVVRLCRASGGKL